MSDEATRLRRAKKFNRNPVAKEMYEKYSERVIHPKKTQYKRERLDPRNIDKIIEKEENNDQ